MTHGRLSRFFLTLCFQRSNTVEAEPARHLLRQVSSKTPFCAFCLATCRAFGSYPAVWMGRSPILRRRRPICWRPVIYKARNRKRIQPAQIIAQVQTRSAGNPKERRLFARHQIAKVMLFKTKNIRNGRTIFWRRIGSGSVRRFS